MTEQQAQSLATQWHSGLISFAEFTRQICLEEITRETARLNQGEPADEQPLRGTRAR